MRFLSLLFTLSAAVSALPAPTFQNATQELGTMFVAGTSAGALSSVLVPKLNTIPMHPVVKGGLSAGVTSVVFLSLIDLVEWISSKMSAVKTNEAAGTVGATSGAASSAAVLPSTGCCPRCGVQAALLCPKEEVKAAQPVKETCTGSGCSGHHHEHDHDEPVVRANAIVADHAHACSGSGCSGHHAHDHDEPVPVADHAHACSGSGCSGHDHHHDDEVFESHAFRLAKEI